MSMTDGVKMDVRWFNGGDCSIREEKCHVRVRFYELLRASVGGSIWRALFTHVASPTPDSRTHHYSLFV
jgi:hypothetical protein